MDDTFCMLDSLAWVNVSERAIRLASLRHSPLSCPLTLGPAMTGESRIRGVDLRARARSRVVVLPAAVGGLRFVSGADDEKKADDGGSLADGSIGVRNAQDLEGGPDRSDGKMDRVHSLWGCAGADVPKIVSVETYLARLSSLSRKVVAGLARGRWVRCEVLIDKAIPRYSTSTGAARAGSQGRFQVSRA